MRTTLRSTHSRVAAVLLAATASLPGLAPAASYAIDNDVNPRVTAGRIVTDAIDHDTLQPLSDVQHFGFQLGGSVSNPYFTSNPGFNALVGSGLPSGQQLRFDLLRKLVRWDGSGAVRFDDITTGEQLRLQFGAASAVATGTSGFVAGFSMGNIGSGGSIHRHLNAFLEGANPPANGLYFTVLRLSTSNNVALPSRAIYIAYNNGLPLADFQRGMSSLANPLPGDADFDADVEFDDLLVLAQNYDRTNASWFDGDFNRDEAVNFDDLLQLAQRYGTGAVVSGAGFESDWALAQSMVPEPGTLAALSVIVPIALRRRR